MGLTLLVVASIVGTNYLVKIIGPIIIILFYNIYSFKGHKNETAFILGINVTFLFMMSLLYFRDK